MFRYFAFFLIILSVNCFAARPQLDYKPIGSKDITDISHEIPRPEQIKDENIDEFREAYL
jgi:hypothetical protein